MQNVWERIFIIEEEDGISSRYEVSFDYFNTEYRFSIFRNFIVNEWKDAKGIPRDYESKIWALRTWINTHKEEFEPVTPEELFKSPAASRTRKKCNQKKQVLIEAKTNSNESRIFIDLTIEENIKPISRHNNRKELRKKINTSKRKILVEEGESESIIKMKMKKKNKEINANEEKGKRIHRSKEEVKKINSKERFKIKREEAQCFLYALRAITSGFSFDLFIDAFQKINFENQIKLANEHLERNGNERLIYGGKFIGTLNQVRENNGGKFLCAFLINNELHCEGICDHKYSMDITEDVKKSEDQERSFSLYFLKKIK